MDNRAWDSREYDSLNFPYNRIERELSEKPRFVSGKNLYVTTGGKISRRPGTIGVDDSGATKRIDRLWTYQTMETPPKVYLLASIFNSGTGFWEMFYNRLDGGSPGWTMLESYRDVNASTFPHEVIIAKGLAYIKAFPDSGSSEKLGSVIFDGTDLDVKPWGFLGPTTPATVKGALTHMSADITDIALTLNVDSDTGFPAVSFIVQVEYEQMEVTAGLPGTAWTVTRGFNGTTAVAHLAGTPVLWRDWGASDHLVSVNITWKYSYAWKTITGQITNRAPLETNPDKMPSLTGPFFNQIPTITVQGHADTTNIPTIVIFRSTDGGGRMFKLEEIDNPGAGALDYDDDSLESGTGGGTFADPLPDIELDDADPAPSLVSNSPPPTVLAPLEVGVDTPVQCSPMAYYAARIWYGIGNVLFFSGQEEINDGQPEECFPSGTFGNFFRFQFPITNVVSTTNALYVFTLKSTYQITGTNRETFNPRQVFDNIGHPYGHPRGVAHFGATLAVLSHDYRIILMSGDDYRVISDPLFTDIPDAIDDGGEIDIRYMGRLDKEWVIVSSHNSGDRTLSRQWVFDLKKTEAVKENFWFVPWTINSTASVSDIIHEGTGQREMVFALWDGTDSLLVVLDVTTVTSVDNNAASELVTFDMEGTLHLLGVPPGDHVNQLRKPMITPTFFTFYFERTLYLRDIDPDFFYYKDDIWTTPIPATFQEDPARRDFSKGYKTIMICVAEVAQRIALKFSKIGSPDKFELQSLVWTYAPESGA